MGFAGAGRPRFRTGGVDPLVRIVGYQSNLDPNGTFHGFRRISERWKNRRYRSESLRQPGGHARNTPSLGPVHPFGRKTPSPKACVVPPPSSLPNVGPGTSPLRPFRNIAARLRTPGRSRRPSPRPKRLCMDGRWTVLDDLNPTRRRPSPDHEIEGSPANYYPVPLQIPINPKTPQSFLTPPH